MVGQTQNFIKLKKLLYPQFSPRQIISFQLHHSQRTLTGVHSCFNEQRLCSRYNILYSIGRKGHFTIFHLQLILYSKFYASPNICFILICTYLYVHIVHTFVCTYLYRLYIQIPIYLSLTACSLCTRAK